MLLSEQFADFVTDQTVKQPRLQSEIAALGK
jgi:hypothetical protein